MDTETAEPPARFIDFVGRAETRLRRALVASYGPSVGRDATVDALSWAWEHWDQLQTMTNPIGYLYRVGQTAARRYQPTQRVELVSPEHSLTVEDVAPELMPALAQLSVQQRSAVVLVHGYGMTQRHAAEVLDISVSTVREHLTRGMNTLRRLLEDDDER
jgi:RNA polymerase sigma factor (sigma-70 family)